MNNKLLYGLLGVVGIFLLVIGAVLAFILQTPKPTQQQPTYQSPVPKYSPPVQNNPFRVPAPTYTPSPSLGQDDYQQQLDELRRQQEELGQQQKEEQQRLQNQLDEQKQQMREGYLELARQNQATAKALFAQREDLYMKVIRGDATQAENREVDRLYQLAMQYQKQADYYQSLAYGY